MRHIEAVKARWIRFKATHYNWFPEGHRLTKLKNCHEGHRCFIVGNGPSLTAEDLTLLSENSEITFAFNRIFYMFEETPWRPMYYISQDEKMAKGSAAQIEAMSVRWKFLPAEFRWYQDIDIQGVIPFHIINREKDGYPAFSDDISRGVINSRTVVYTAIQFAAYMGIKEIYLIGVDHHFHTSVNNKGEIIIDAAARDYFSEKYNADKEKLYIPNTDLSTMTFIAAKKYADQRGIRIINATRGGKLEVFERVKLETLFEK